MKGSYKRGTNAMSRQTTVLLVPCQPACILALLFWSMYEAYEGVSLWQSLVSPVDNVLCGRQLMFFSCN